ncbi:MAG: hypothetical protein HWE16_03310 [Gammaproteobacteria bacterium]|nr:hypothetical protein [Gammaproteobacteria bacterium]
MIKSLSIISTLVIGLAAPLSLSALETERQLTLDATNIQSLLVDTGAGSLNIQGKAGIKEIQVKAQISVDGVDKDEADEWFADHMNLSLTNDNGQAIFCASFSYSSKSKCSTKKKLRDSWFGWNDERKIDVTIYMPENLALEVDDGSGNTEIRDIASKVFVDDGSGHLEIANIAGNLKVDDGSGDLIITNIQGDLYVDDGSGKLIIDQVTGEVEVDDGSGNIKVTNVAKKVYIDDGSGSVEACHLGGDLTVDDGSGSVDTCDDIKGQVVIK